MVHKIKVKIDNSTPYDLNPINEPRYAYWGNYHGSVGTIKAYTTSEAGYFEGSYVPTPIGVAGCLVFKIGDTGYRALLIVSNPGFTIFADPNWADVQLVTDEHNGVEWKADVTTYNTLYKNTSFPCPAKEVALTVGKIMAASDMGKENDCEATFSFSYSNKK